MTRPLLTVLAIVLPIVFSTTTAPVPIAAQERPSAPSGPSIELNGESEEVEDGRVTARSLSLTEALDIALAESIELALARAEEQIARGRRMVARGALLPSLELGAAAGRKDGRIQGSFGNLQDEMYSTYAAGAGLVYEANLVSGLHEAIAERKGVEAANLERLDTEQKLLLRVAELYQNLMLATVGVRVAGQVVDSSERFLSIVQAREEAGLGLGSDVALAEAKLASDRRQAIEAARLRDQTSMRLALVLRLDAAIPLDPIEGRLEPIHLTAPAGEEGAPRPGARPDVRAAQQRAEAARNQSRAARWEIWSPDLRAEVRRIEIGEDPDDLQERSERRGLIVWDISPGEVGRLRQRRAEADAARLRAQEVVDRARTEILEVRSGLEAAREIIPLAERGVAAAAETLRLNEARFRAGTAIALEVLDAQNVLARSRLALARAIVAFNTTQVRLLAAMGTLSRDSFAPLEAPQR